MTTMNLLLIAILAIMIVAAPFVALLKDFLPAQVEKSANIDQNENRIYVLHSEIHEAQARLNGLMARRNQHSAENQRIDAEARKAERTIREIENQPPLFIHEVGEPRANLSKFLFNLSLTKSSSDSGKAPINPIWRCANQAEVWATTLDEAKQAVEITFPFKLGYNKSTVRQPTPAAKKPGEEAAGTAGTAAAAAGAPTSSMLPTPAPGRELRRPSMGGAPGADESPPEAADAAGPPPAEAALAS